MQKLVGRHRRSQSLRQDRCDQEPHELENVCLVGEDLLDAQAFRQNRRDRVVCNNRGSSSSWRQRGQAQGHDGPTGDQGEDHRARDPGAHLRDDCPLRGRTNASKESRGATTSTRATTGRTTLRGRMIFAMDESLLECSRRRSPEGHVTPDAHRRRFVDETVGYPHGYDAPVSRSRSLFRSDSATFPVRYTMQALR